MDISIIIPAYNESKKIGLDIEAAFMFLTNNNLSGELIVVDDGSIDGTSITAKEAAAGLPENIEVKILSYNEHKGKGYAVRTGIINSKGSYVMYADSGRCVPFDYILKGLDLLKGGDCVIAHGSRKLSSSRILKKQSAYRRFLSMVFHRLVICCFGIPSELTDTQCGFKIYSGNIARQLYEKCVTNGFMFDIEIILRALKKGYTIKEFAIEWSCDRDSRLLPGKNLLNIFSELRAIKKAAGKF
jgi:dolichyl-phosphate beta-glucosyltransferase